MNHSDHSREKSEAQIPLLLNDYETTSPSIPKCDRSLLEVGAYRGSDSASADSFTSHIISRTFPELVLTVEQVLSAMLTNL